MGNLPSGLIGLTNQRNDKSVRQALVGKRAFKARFFIFWSSGAAHLAGVTAAHTILPVLGVPMKSDALNGMDSLLATVQMPAGIPVGTLAIGKPGAKITLE